MPGLTTGEVTLCLRQIEEGDRDAMVQISKEYKRGEHLPQDPKEAKFWRDAAIAKGWKPKRNRKPKQGE